MEKNNRILIVDDQKDLCDQLAKLLLKTGKSNDTLSLVQQMRARLMGARDPVPEENKERDISLYEVDYVYQGMDAVAKIAEALKEKKPYALVFLDMRMPPGWDGLETAKKIRELDKDVEIVIMTAYADHDQKQIAEQVGHPEKLLYIKKPFQAEEIYQLALSLTAKWNLEWTEKRRKKWLESIIRGLCKLKSPNVSKTVTGAFIPALKSFLDLMDSDKGLAASYSSSSDKWQLHCFNGMSEDEAVSFLNQNSKFLNECRTTKHNEDKYFLPLRKDNFFAMIVIFNVQTKNDPDWYKLLSILSMTVSDIIGECVELGIHSNPAKIAALPKMLGKLRVSAEEHIGAITSNLNMIKEQGAEQLVLDLVSKSLNAANEFSLDIRNALFCSGEIKANMVNTELLPILREAVETGSMGKTAFKFNGDEKIKIKTDPAMLKDAFANLANNSMMRSREAVWIEIEAKKEGNTVIISYADNAPEIPPENREKLFCLLNGNNTSETGLPIAAMIISELGGKIQLQQNSNGSGTKFLIELPA